VFTPVLAKHTKSFNLVDTLSVGVDRIQRNFEPLQRQVELWRKTQITDDTAKLIFYSTFVDGKLDAPMSLLSEVHRLYFEPQYEEFSPRTMWSLSNAFTSAFKKLDQQDACTKIHTKITAEFPARNKILRILCIFPTQRILANSDTSILMNHQIPEPYVTPEEAADFLRTNRLKVIRMARSGLLPAHPLGSTKRRQWRFKLSELDKHMQGGIETNYPPVRQ
jgi:excisionase family DNA binding protein